jgi:serine phosphatase RsbU (regulator of sigma subunit)
MDLRSREITFSNAGVQFSPLLVSAEGAVSSFKCGGMPISFVSEGEYDVCSFTLKAGESFFINTDGLLEQTNSVEIYGQQTAAALNIGGGINAGG